MYEAITHQIKVTVAPFYIEQQSNPDAHRYFWAYQVSIENLGADVVQLRDRFWRISDANGRVEEVHGPGVIGEQPTLQPGGTFQYTSGCPLTTPSGFMVGTYTMMRENGTLFIIDIPAFSLDLPDARNAIN